MYGGDITRKDKNMESKYVVQETCKHGGAGKHFFPTLHSALWNKQEMEQAHPGRKYQLVVPA